MVRVVVWYVVVVELSTLHRYPLIPSSHVPTLPLSSQQYVALTIGWKRVCSSSPISSFISRFTILRWWAVFIAFTYSSTRAVSFAGSFISGNDMLLLLLFMETDTTLGCSRMYIHIAFPVVFLLKHKITFIPYKHHYIHTLQTSLHSYPTNIITFIPYKHHYIIPYKHHYIHTLQTSLHSYPTNIITFIPYKHHYIHTLQTSLHSYPTNIITFIPYKHHYIHTLQTSLHSYPTNIITFIPYKHHYIHTLQTSLHSYPTNIITFIPYKHHYIYTLQTSLHSYPTNIITFIPYKHHYIHTLQTSLHLYPNQIRRIGFGSQNNRPSLATLIEGSIVGLIIVIKLNIQYALPHRQ